MLNIKYVLEQVKRDLPKRPSLDSVFEASDRKSAFIHDAEFHKPLPNFLVAGSISSLLEGLIDTTILTMPYH